MRKKIKCFVLRIGGAVRSLGANFVHEMFIAIQRSTGDLKIKEMIFPAQHLSDEGE